MGAKGGRKGVIVSTERHEAVARGENKYVSRTPCPQCGGTLRYTRAWGCVACIIVRSRANHAVDRVKHPHKRAWKEPALILHRRGQAWLRFWRGIKSDYTPDDLLHQWLTEYEYWDDRFCTYYNKPYGFNPDLWKRISALSYEESQLLHFRARPANLGLLKRASPLDYDVPTGIESDASVGYK